MTKQSKFIGDDDEAKSWQVIKGGGAPDDAEEKDEDEFLAWSDQMDAADAARTKRQDAKRLDTIKEEDGKFCVYSEDGSKKLGEYDTREEAETRLSQIEHFKGDSGEDDDYDEPDDQDEAEAEFEDWSDEMDAKRRHDDLGAIASEGVDITRPPPGDDDETPIMQRSDAYLHAFAQTRRDGSPDQERAENGQFGSGSGTSAGGVDHGKAAREHAKAAGKLAATLKQSGHPDAEKAAKTAKAARGSARKAEAASTPEEAAKHAEAAKGHFEKNQATHLASVGKAAHATAPAPKPLAAPAVKSGAAQLAEHNQRAAAFQKVSAEASDAAKSAGAEVVKEHDAKSYGDHNVRSHLVNAKMSEARAAVHENAAKTVSDPKQAEMHAKAAEEHRAAAAMHSANYQKFTAKPEAKDATENKSPSTPKVVGTVTLGKVQPGDHFSVVGGSGKVHEAVSNQPTSQGYRKVETTGKGHDSTVNMHKTTVVNLHEKPGAKAEEKKPAMSSKEAKQHDTSGTHEFHKQVDDYEHSGDTEGEANHLSSIGANVTGTHNGHDDGEAYGRVSYKVPAGVSHSQFKQVLETSHDTQGYHAHGSPEAKGHHAEGVKHFNEAVHHVKAGRGEKAAASIAKAQASFKARDATKK